MRFLQISLLMLLFISACATPTPEPDEEPTPLPEDEFPSLAGSWQASSNISVFEVLGNLQYLRFTETTALSGRLEVFGVDAETNVLVCDQLVYASVADDVVSLFSEFLGSRLLVFEKSGEDSLTLTNEKGANQTFTKVESVPTSAICEVGNFQANFENIPVDLTDFTNLLSDGTNLRVSSEDGNVYPINPDNGQLGTGIPLGGDFNLGGTFNDTLTMQGSSDFWAHCGCGGSQEIVRFQAGATAATDVIDTETDLANEINIKGAAFDGTHVWLAGRSEGSHLVLKVDAEAEPDVLISSFTFGQSIEALTFHEGQMWVLLDVFGLPKLVQLETTPDSTTFKAVRTITLPELSQGRYQGLTSLGDSLFLLAQVSSSVAAVYRFTP